jgi:cytochrome c556
MRTPILIAALLGIVTAVYAQHAEDLPAGPIRDRHELMEGIGKNAKVIGDALKSGNFSPVGDAAAKIETSAVKVPLLFPKGSTDPKSRAKPEIWDNWKKFEELAKQLHANAGELARTAKGGGDVKARANDLFATCKSCHDDFRKPEEKK